MLCAAEDQHWRGWGQNSSAKTQKDILIVLVKVEGARSILICFRKIKRCDASYIQW